jgi:hypothetical protein
MIGEVAGIGTGFKGAITYLLLGKKDEPNPDRVAWTQLRNLPTDNPKLAPRLMRATANQSARCAKPLYHLVLSWREDENPTDEMMQAHVDDTLRDLELLDHQAFIAAHKDTQHRHVHLIINRVHPETTKAWSRSMDYARIEISIRRQMEERGLAYVPGRHNDPEKFGLKSRHVKRGEYRSAIHSGKERPLDHWSTGQINERRESLLGYFDSARSWDQLSRMLAADGIALKRKGQGIVLEGGDGFMKLSELRKDIRLGALESLYGEAFADYAARSPDVLVPARHVERRKAVVPAPTVTRKPKPTDEDSADDPNAPLDPSEIERLREEARLERIARREEELARRADQRRKGGSTGGNDSGSTAAAVRVPDTGNDRGNGSGVPTANEPAPSPRGEAFTALGKTREALDLAKRLHEMGLMDNAALERAKHEVEDAQDSLEPHLSMGERLTNEVGDALRNMARADKGKGPPPQPAPPKKLKRPKFKKKDRDERER